MSVAAHAPTSEGQASEGAVPVRLLLVEDNPADVFFLIDALDGRYPGRYATAAAATMNEAEALLAEHEFDVALLDLTLPDSRGLGTIETLAQFAPELPIVVLTGIDDDRIVPDVVRCGAQDYLLKGQSDSATIARAIQYAIDRKRIEGELRAQRRELERKNSELQEAQNRLEMYRDRYVDLYDFAPLGYLTLDEDGFVQEINLAGAKLLGADRGAVTGYPFSNYVMKEDVAIFLEMVRQCVAEHRDATCELRLTADGGRLITAQLRSVPIKVVVEGMGGETATFCKTAIADITGRKEMEEAIRQSRAFLQTVIDAMPEALSVISRDYRVVLANRSARALCGETDLASDCLPCYRLIHRDGEAAQDRCDPCPLRQAVATKAPVSAVQARRDAAGREAYYEVNAAPVFNDKGEVTHIVETCHDVSDRQRKEQTLVDDRNLLRALIDDLPDCIYVKDVEGRFLAANLATARIMGAAAPSDLLGKTDFDFYPPELAARYRADEEDLLRSGKPLINHDEPRQQSGGAARTILTTKMPMRNDEGKIVGLVGISREIPDRR